MSGSNGGHEFYVKSTSETNVDFEHYFIIPLSRRRRQETSEVPISNPIIGKFAPSIVFFEDTKGTGIMIRLGRRRFLCGSHGF